MYFREFYYLFDEIADLLEPLAIVMVPGIFILGILFCFAGYRLFFRKKKSIFKALTIGAILAGDAAVVFATINMFDNILISAAIGLGIAVTALFLLKPLMIIITCIIGDILMVLPLSLVCSDESLLLLAGGVIGILGFTVQILTNKKKKIKDEISETNDKISYGDKKKKKRKAPKNEKITKVKQKKKRRKRKPVYKRTLALFSRINNKFKQRKYNRSIKDKDDTLYDENNVYKSKTGQSYKNEDSTDNVDKTVYYKTSKEKELDDTMFYKRDVDKTLCEKINETQNIYDTLYDENYNKNINKATYDDSNKDRNINNTVHDKKCNDDINETVYSQSNQDIDNTAYGSNNVDKAESRKSDKNVNIDNTIYENSKENNNKFENSYEEYDNEYYEDDEYYEEDDEEYEIDVFDRFEEKFWKVVDYLEPKYIKLKKEIKIKAAYWIPKIIEYVKEMSKKFIKLVKDFIDKRNNNHHDDNNGCYKGDTEEIPVINEEDL